jgi:hydroxypyruvate reductase
VGGVALSFPRDWPDRTPLLDAFEAALDAVDPEYAVRRSLTGTPLAQPPFVVAIGKAAAAMARGVPGPSSGIVVSDHAEPVPDGYTAYLGSHPIPDERSLLAGRAVLEALATGSSPLLFLISGGASALCEVPADGVEIQDVGRLTAALLRSGADIEAINAVRTQISKLKGGRLAALVADRRARTLLVSDVVGDPVEAIGSGPTVPGTATPAEATAVLERFGIEPPESIASLLKDALVGSPAGSPLHSVEVIANGAVAAEAAVRTAEAAGITARIETTELTGDAQAQAASIVTAPGETGMTFFAGETTVEVTGGGVGGRNQHAALAAALLLDGSPDDVLFGTLATDGVDGPTDGAGAVVDSGTVDRGRRAGLDAWAYLNNHASHPFLEASCDLLRIGPSGTNVGDLWVVWRR